MGARFADGVFVGEHGSWNRSVPVGYKVVFVPFRDGRPAGAPVDFVTGFLGDDGKTRGRPVGVTVDPRGALIVADDLSNTIWRIVPARRAPAAEAPTVPPKPPGNENKPGSRDSRLTRDAIRALAPRGRDRAAAQSDTAFVICDFTEIRAAGTCSRVADLPSLIDQIESCEAASRPNSSRSAVSAAILKAVVRSEAGRTSVIGG